MSRTSTSNTGVTGLIPDSYVTSSTAQNPVTYVAYAAYLDYSGSTMRVWTGLNNITLTDDFGGGTYTALGQFGSIGTAQEVNDVSAKTYELTLSGIPSGMISTALNDNFRGRYVAVYQLMFTADYSSYQRVTAFRGWMDQMTIVESGTTSTIKLTCESRLIQLQNPIIQWYSDQFQQHLYPGDLGLQYVTAAATQGIYWGSSAPSMGSQIASPLTGNGGVINNRVPN